MLFLGDGFISLDEYVKIMTSNFVSIDIERERMKVAFNLVDRNNDGRISLAEFRAVMTHNNTEMSQEKVDQLFQEVDKEGKGYLDYQGRAPAGRNYLFSSESAIGVFFLS